MTFLDRLQVSFSQLAAVIPALFGALVILFAGYLLARLVQRGAERLFRRMQLNALLERGGVLQAVERSGTHPNPTRIVANLAFWFVMFSVLLLAANAVGLESLAEVFSQPHFPNSRMAEFRIRAFFTGSGTSTSVSTSSPLSSTELVDICFQYTVIDRIGQCIYRNL